MRTVQYEPHVITYLDILGFKDIVATKSAGFVSRLIRIVQQRTRPSGWTVKVQGIRYQNFSDLCVIATPIRGHQQRYDSQGLFFLELLGLVHAQTALLEEEVFVRGGITIGPLVMSYNVLYGPGLVKAYQLEQTAVYPRIVVDPDALKTVGNDSIFWVDDREKEMEGIQGLLRTEQGISYVDYLRACDSEFDAPEYEYPAFLAKHRHLIQANLGLHTDNARIREKYEWLARYHNTVVSEQLSSEVQARYLISIPSLGD